MSRVFDAWNLEHFCLRDQTFVSQTNTVKLFGFFDQLVEQGASVASNAFVTRPFALSARDRTALRHRLGRGIAIYSTIQPSAHGQYVRTSTGARCK